MDLSTLSQKQRDALSNFLERDGLDPATATDEILESKYGSFATDPRQLLNRFMNSMQRQAEERQANTRVSQAQIQGARWRLSLPAAKHRDAIPDVISDVKRLAFRPATITNALEASMIIDGFDGMAEFLGAPVQKRSAPEAANSALGDNDTSVEGENPDEPF